MEEKITRELLKKACKGDYNSLQKVIMLTSFNSDGTDKSKCFFVSIRKNNTYVDLGDIIYLYHQSLWCRMREWQKKEVYHTESQFHQRFINSVWIKVYYSFLDHLRKKINEDSSVTLVSLDDETVNLKNKLKGGDETNDFIHQEFANTIIKLLPKKRKRWGIVLENVMKGKNVKEISIITGVSTVTIRNDFKKLTELFYDLNSL